MYLDLILLETNRVMWAYDGQRTILGKSDGKAL